MRGLGSALAGVIASTLLGCSTADGSPTVQGPTTTEPTSTPATAATTATTALPATTAPPTTAAPVDVFALRPPTPGSGPAALAAQIEQAERTIRDPAAPAADVARAALAQQVAYRKLGGHPEWDAEVFATLPEDLHAAAMINLEARRLFRSMHRRLSPTLPAWQIIEPPPAEGLLANYQKAQDAFGIPWQYLAAINLVESGTGRIHGTSTAGAQGPMQFMPATWAAYGDGGDINDPHDAIMGAARYLAANNGATDIAGALYRYNHSQRYVRGVQLYAAAISLHPRAFFGYYHWGVWFLTDRADVYLPVGYSEPAPVPVEEYLAR